MSDSQNPFLGGYADDAHSSPEVEGPNRDVIISSDEEHDNQQDNDHMEEDEPEVIDGEQPIESLQTPFTADPSSSGANTTEVLDVAPLDTSTFNIHPVNLQPAQNVPGPRNLTPFSSPFPSVSILPPPNSSTALAPNTTPSSSSTLAIVAMSLPPSTSTDPTLPQFSEREVSAWNSLMGELGKEGEAILLREEQEKAVAEENARKAAAYDTAVKEKESSSKQGEEPAAVEIAATNLAIIAAAIEVEISDSDDELPLIRGQRLGKIPRRKRF